MFFKNSNWHEIVHHGRNCSSLSCLRAIQFLLCMKPLIILRVVRDVLINIFQFKKLCVVEFTFRLDHNQKIYSRVVEEFQYSRSINLLLSVKIGKRNRKIEKMKINILCFDNKNHKQTKHDMKINIIISTKLYIAHHYICNYRLSWFHIACECYSTASAHTVVVKMKRVTTAVISGKDNWLENIFKWKSFTCQKEDILFMFLHNLTVNNMFQRKTMNTNIRMYNLWKEDELWVGLKKWCDEMSL